MSKKVRVLLKKLILFLGLYGSALIVGTRLLMVTNQDLDDYRQHQDKN